jgi:hypothetical protein
MSATLQCLAVVKPLFQHVGRDNILRLCCQRLGAMPVDDRIPPFLTVEEASRLLKIGRTKAYELTKEWRATGGRSGLPVIDLGDVLRVPGPALEQMLGTGMAASRPTTGEPTGNRAKPRSPLPADAATPPATPDEYPVQPVQPPAAAPPAGSPCVPPARSRRQRRRPTNQLPLFQPLTLTNPDPQSPSPDDPEMTTHP